jgi:hypothetical protein
MNFRLNGINRVRLVILLFALMLVAGLGSMTNLAQVGPAGGLPGAPGAPAPYGPVGAAPSRSSASAPAGDPAPGAVKVGYDAKHDVSPALRDIKPVAAWQGKAPDNEPAPVSYPDAHVTDPIVQRWLSPLAIPTTIVNFEGVNNRNGVYPPDTNGDVGPNHFVQWVNLSYQIWNKSGVSLLGPANGNTIFSGFGGACQTTNAGDPVVLYDSIADRWLLSQFTSSNPFGECIAISTSSDPTGTYNRYFFQLSTTVFYDYPHLGVWPDGYYMSANLFNGGSGSSALVFDRTRMLQGLSATYQEKLISTSQQNSLPSDLDGPTLPPAGEPNFFARFSGTNTFQVYKFHVDWTTPANTTFTGPTNITVATFDSNLCGGSRNCIPQPGTTVKLDAIGDRLMHRLSYRNFGDHEMLLANHNVDTNGADLAGVRWYEIRNPNGSPTVFQQHRKPWHTLYRQAGWRSPRHAPAGRRHHHSRQRLTNRHRIQVGRLQLHVGGSHRRLYLLVHERVRADHRRRSLADPHRLVQVPFLHRGSDRYAYPHPHPHQYAHHNSNPHAHKHCH